MLTYISNSTHYEDVLSRVQSVKHMLWIGTADIKDLYVEVVKEKKPFLALIAQLIRRGVEVRLIHAKEPGPNFREDFDKYPVLYDRLERVLCPRVHFKMLLFDGKEVYVGSANLTGAGIGMKAETTRNFEAGILTKESRIPSPIQISITASVSHPNMPNHPILSAEQPRNYRQTSKNDHH